MRRLRISDKKGQVWVETVIYTLIGLAVIGILLAVSKPKIDSIKDKLIIEQSIDSMTKISDKVYEVQRAPGNKRVVDLQINEGAFVVDMDSDTIYWRINSRYQYSEVGSPVPLGNMIVTTTEASPWLVELKIEFPVDIRFSEENSGVKELGSAPTPYSLKIENYGRSDAGETIIDVSE